MPSATSNVLCNSFSRSPVGREGGGEGGREGGGGGEGRSVRMDITNVLAVTTNQSYHLG